MSWLRALNATARSGLRIERKRLEPLIALRGAAGLALVMGLSLWAFGPGAAASSAFGAFQAAIATFQRSWRPRPELALASGASLAVSTFVGYVTISHLALFLTLLVVWTFLSGMSWAAGPTAGLIASSNVAIMLVTVTLPTSVAQAAGHSAMMIVGGLVQASLVVLFPVRRWGAHRDALADALAAEADYARRLRHDPVAPFDPLPLMEARDAAAVTPRQARRRPAELHGTRGLAERIRPVLASLADPAMGVPSECPQRDRVNELLAAAAAILDGAARAIRHGTPVNLPPGAVAVFRTPDTEAILTGPPYRAATRLGTLLQDVVETAGGRRYDVAVDSEGAVMGGTGAAVGRPGETGAAPLLRPTFIAMIPVALRAMREELHRDSPIYRHAIRVSAVAAAGYVLGTSLPLGHGYWAPLASVMIMRPDFSQTYSRAIARFCGTLVGVALATGIVQVAHPGTILSGTLAVISAALMYLLMRTSQMAAQAFLAAYVVFLLGMGGEQWTQTVPERVLLTLLGGLLAMLAYALYPAWETPRLRGRLADWLAAQGRYASAVLSRYAHPAGPQPTADRATTPGRRAPATPNPEDDGRGHAPADTGASGGVAALAADHGPAVPDDAPADRAAADGEGVGGDRAPAPDHGPAAPDHVPAPAPDPVREALLASGPLVRRGTRLWSGRRTSRYAIAACPGPQPTTRRTPSLRRAGSPCSWRPTSRNGTRPPSRPPPASPRHCGRPPSRAPSRCVSAGCHAGTPSARPWKPGRQRALATRFCAGARA